MQPGRNSRNNFFPRSLHFVPEDARVRRAESRRQINEPASVGELLCTLLRIRYVHLRRTTHTCDLQPMGRDVTLGGGDFVRGEFRTSRKVRVAEPGT